MRMEQMTVSFFHQMLLTGVLAGVVSAAHAGRPLGTDDAGVADAGTCQVESWIERQDKQHAWVTSPACGVISGVELGAEYVRPEHSGTLGVSAGMALKWVPESWQMVTPWGDLNWGLKVSTGHAKPPGAQWETTDSTVALLATLSASDNVAVHVNTGVTRDRASSVNGTLLNVAAVWTPAEPWLLFAETQAYTHTDVFGKPVTSTGVRYWLISDKLGVDLTASHQPNSPTLWTFGIGWYGLFK